MNPMDREGHNDREEKVDFLPRTRLQEGRSGEGGADGKTAGIGKGKGSHSSKA